MEGGGGGSRSAVSIQFVRPWLLSQVGTLGFMTAYVRNVHGVGYVYLFLLSLVDVVDVDFDMYREGCLVCGGTSM